MPHLLDNNKPKPLSQIDAALEGEAFSKLDGEVKKQLETSFNQLLNESGSYEEAFKKLEKLFNGTSKEALEEFMFRALSNAELLGYED